MTLCTINNTTFPIKCKQDK